MLAPSDGKPGPLIDAWLVENERICELLRIKPPWRMLGGVALGWPAQPPVPTTRKALEKVTEWFEETPG